MHHHPHRTIWSAVPLTLLLAAVILPVRADLVQDWNQTLTQVIQTEGNSHGNSNPGWSTRAMAMMNAAIYDTFQAVDRTHQPFHVDTSVANASKQVAAMTAAHAIIVANYPSQTTTATTALTQALSLYPDSATKTNGVTLGNTVASSYIAWRADDGASSNVPYTPTAGPGRWQPDPTRPTTQQAWGPAWGSVRPFALSNSRQIALAPPPSITSAAYAASYNQVRALGGLHSTTRTPDQTQAGLFWAYDRPNMGPPPVLYIKNILEISRQLGLTESQNAQIFAQASIAMADSSIAAWDAKFDSDLWRPVTGIRDGELDGNPLTTGDPTWVPLGAPGADPLSTADDFTPPFPAYVSGHATMGESVYATLASILGTDTVTFSLTSDELPGVTRDYTSLSAASDENSLSRVYLGVHWDFDSIEGQNLGRGIAGHVAQNHFLPVPEPTSASFALLALMLHQRRRRRL